jgi:hypothetical protein
MLHRWKNIFPKIIAVIFFIIAVAPLFFSSLLLIKQQYARHKMKEKLVTGLLHTIILPEKDIVWVKKNKEIRIDKELFDVKNILKENNKIIITGVFDHEETEIEQKLGHLSGNPNSPNTMLTNLFTLLQNIFSGTGGLEIQYDFTSPIENKFDFTPSLPELPHTVITPPPQTMISC